MLDVDLLELGEAVDVAVVLLDTVLVVSFLEKSPDRNMTTIKRVMLADVSAIEYILYLGFGDFLIKYQIPIMPIIVSNDKIFFI